MKIAYFITLHHKLNQFRWLWQAIYSRDDVYCIHVDAKAPQSFHAEVREYIGNRPNVIYLPSRSIAWSGWSMVSAELGAMNLMLGFSNNWRYWINLSGQDYPIKPMAVIRQSLMQSGLNFIRVWSFDRVAREEPNDPHLRRQAFIEFRGKIRNLRVPVPLPTELRYKGSTWHMLTREFVACVQTAAIANIAARRIRFLFCPDEIFFQAVIMNSPFRDARADDCGRFVLWPGPKILREENAEELTASPDCLFARKFDEVVDRAILQRLAHTGGYSTP
ncbi:MAG: beta-1,6-N-acetylglucosaminyltransferase [Terriglobales bacterium]